MTSTMRLSHRNGWGPSILPVVVASFSGCGISGPDAESRVGVIEYYGEIAEISVPESVSVGADFPVALYTLGNGCVRHGHTVVEVQEGVTVLTPYDTYILDA